MNAAAKGRRFEHSIRSLFEREGFSFIRGAGSKGELWGQKVDLVATKQERLNEYEVQLTVIGAQCKVRRRTHGMQDGD